MNILFYTPFNQRSRDTESVMIKFRETGHRVFFIGQGGEIEDVLRTNGIEVFRSPEKSKNSWMSLGKEILFLIRFCRKHQIDLVFSHLETAHFPAVLAQFFFKAKLVVCRHHADDMYLNNKSGLLSYKLTYTFGKHFIVVSAKAKEFMISHEKIDPASIDIINLAYDFRLYNPVNTTNANTIRQEYKADLLLVIAGRLVKNKRPELAIEVIERLLKQGVDAKLLMLGEGAQRAELDQLIAGKDLKERCFLLGNKYNILDYFHASDILLHPSLSEASCVVVKEAGLVSRPVVVCKDVGDFNDYIETGKNGILVSKENFIEETMDFLLDYIADRRKYDGMGPRLKEDVLRLFHIENVFPAYEKYLAEGSLLKK